MQRLVVDSFDALSAPYYFPRHPGTGGKKGRERVCLPLVLSSAPGSSSQPAICASCRRLPTVSSSTATMTGPMLVGGCVKVTPSAVSLSYSA